MHASWGQPSLATRQLFVTPLLTWAQTWRGTFSRSSPRPLSRPAVLVELRFNVAQVLPERFDNERGRVVRAVGATCFEQRWIAFPKRGCCGSTWPSRDADIQNLRTPSRRSGHAHRWAPWSSKDARRHRPISEKPLVGHPENLLSQASLSYRSASHLYEFGFVARRCGVWKSCIPACRP